MSGTSSDHIRELLTRQLADPGADLDAATIWCEAWIERTAYWRSASVTYTPLDLAHMAVGAYRLSHLERLDRTTRLLIGKPLS